MTSDSDLNLLKQLIKFNSSKRTRKKKVPSWTKNMSKISQKRGAARRTTWKTGGRRRHRRRRRRQGRTRTRTRRSHLVMSGGRRRKGRRKIHQAGSIPAEALRGLGRRVRKPRMSKFKGRAIPMNLLLGGRGRMAKERVQPNYMSWLQNYRRSLQ